MKNAKNCESRVACWEALSRAVFDLSQILSSILPRTESIRALWPEKVTGPGQRTGQRTHNQGRIIPEEASAG